MLKREPKRKKSAMSLSSLDKNKRYLLACSYGPDSMAAFYLLLKDGYSFEVAIVNYHLRPESNDEVKGLKEYADKHNIKLHVLDVKEKITSNIEKRCRDIRYKFFASLVNEYKFDAVIIAQHMDDNIETYLLQKNRRILPNCWGISEKTSIFGVKVIRPLLPYTKDDLLAICRENNIPYAIDKTNLSDEYARNRIRHQIVEKMSREEKTIVCEEINKKNTELKKIFDSIDINKTNDIAYVLSLDNITYLYVLNILVKKLDESLCISKKQADEVRRILFSDKPNVVAEIKRNVFISKQYDKFLFLTHSNDEGVSYSIQIDEPMEFECEYFYLNFTSGAESRNVHLNDYPLTIRTFVPGDKYVISGYEVSVRRLFIDWKMPLFLRGRWPLITNKDGKIIYIPRYQKNFTGSEDINFYVKY